MHNNANGTWEDELIQIKQNHDRLAVLVDGKIRTHGFMTVEDALHSVWVLNGKVPEHFYNANEDGIVTMEVKTPKQ